MSYILIIEDDESIRTLLKQFITFEGFAAAAVEHGKEALNLLETTPVVPDLILLDLNMPEMNGWEFLRILRKNPSWQNIPVIVITASALSNIRPLAADAVLTKPLELDELFALCLKWCGQPGRPQLPEFSAPI